MRKLEQVVILLSKIENGADIYDQSEARYLTQFRYSHPSYITIVCSDTPDEKGAYFHAQLTGRGKAHLTDLRSNHEVSGLREAVHEL